MPADRRLPTPEPGRWAAEAFVAEHLGHLLERRSMATEAPSSVVRGGQQAADAALDRFTVDGYADGMLEAYPQPRRTVSHLSPWIRHGLLPLGRLWEAAGRASGADDENTFKEALLWQEYARHWYARLGADTRNLGVRPTASTGGKRADDRQHPPGVAGTAGWDRRLGCVEISLDELEEDGWLVDAARRWLASQWTVRDQRGWLEGEEYFHRHLLDGSRAANRLGWLRISGAAGEPPVEFSRWEVEQRAPGLCATCELVHQCPIEDWPAVVPEQLIDDHPLLRHDPALPVTAGPSEVMRHQRPETVWLTAESLGDADPALSANPGLPAIFIFDEPLLAKLRLSSKRLVFLTETLSELAARRPVEIWLGHAVSVLADRAPAATFTPVPGWRRKAVDLLLAEVHPWSWLCPPHDSRIDSFRCWRDGISLTMNEEQFAGGRHHRTVGLSRWL